MSVGKIAAAIGLPEGHLCDLVKEVTTECGGKVVDLASKKIDHAATGVNVGLKVVKVEESGTFTSSEI